MNIIGFENSKCKSCYKCVRTCYVKAITVKNKQAQIVEDKCILCGRCLNTCPQNTKSFISDLDKVKGYLKRGIKTIVSIAPAYLGTLKYNTPGQVVSALMKLGFSQIRETAEGAVYVTREYNKLLNENKMENIITTCCPSVNDLIEIYYPSLTKYMAPVVSPMIAHGKLIREEFGDDVKIVFIGPCISKRREALEDARTRGYIDAVIHFAEVENWLKEEQIDIMSCDDVPPHNPNPMVNRLYPISSGVLSSVVASKKESDNYRKFYVHGMYNCIDLFKSMERGEVKGCFIEANICNGGCIKGPVVDKELISRFKVKLDMEEAIAKKPVCDDNFNRDQEKALSFSKTFSDKSPKELIPSESEIRKILAKIGKTEEKHDLNCGACGYYTCRDKAIAVFQKKAELNMCIPYMHEKAQSMANIIIDTTPNIIIIVDSEMKIIEFNLAAQRHFKKTRAEALEMYLFEFIDHSNFEHVLNTRLNILGRKVQYENPRITTLQNIVYIKSQNNVMGVFQDISIEEEKNSQAYKVKMETIEMAQKVIDKQMMVAQQIAGLLGETTAETKVTLTKLRDTILFDGEIS